MYVEPCISHGTSSTVTATLLLMGENPVPEITKFWPPINPVLGETLVTEGRTVCSYYSSRLEEVFFIL